MEHGAIPPKEEIKELTKALRKESKKSQAYTKEMYKLTTVLTFLTIIMSLTSTNQ